jgi:hypothetical protein
MENLTGAWFDPEIDGSGLAILDAPEGRVVYLYSYADGLPEMGEGQLWMIGQPEDPLNPNMLTFFKPSGSWMGQTYTLGDPVMYADLVLEDDGTLKLIYRIRNMGRCKPVMPGPLPPECRETIWTLQRLTHRGDV